MCRQKGYLYIFMRNDTVLEWDADQNAIETFKGKVKDRGKLLPSTSICAYMYEYVAAGHYVIRNTLY